MESNERKINKNLMTGWVIIVVVLLVAYFGEYLKGERSGIYMLVFSIVTALPPIVCILMYRKNKRDDKLRYYILGGYFIMYAFVLLTGSTTMVFTYILPMLSLIVLYHHASLVLVMGVLSLIANLIFIARMFLNHQITLSNSKDIEIQLALLILCFVCGMEKRDALQSFMEKLFTALKEYIHTKDEYRIATICIGGALSVETGREYSKLFLAADKALYHMKQCRYDGVYLYSESETSPDSQRVLSKTDLEQLVETIKQENRQGTYYALLPEFKSLIDFTQNLGKRNVQDVTLILLTLSPVSEKNTTVAERDEAMQFLENAINGVLRKTDIMTRFSSTQCLILLIGVSMEHLNEISTRIMNNFYKIYDRKNMVVSYDAAQINTAE